MRLSRSDQVARGRRPSRVSGRKRPRSRDAPTDARETRRRYPADEVSRCGRWMQRAGGVALFPEDAPAPKASGWLSAKREPRRGRKGPRETNACAVSPVPEDALRGFVLGRSRAEPLKTRRVAQDCDPKAYMYTPSGRKDARIDHFSWYPPSAKRESAKRMP